MTYFIRRSFIHAVPIIGLFILLTSTAIAQNFCSDAFSFGGKLVPSAAGQRAYYDSDKQRYRSTINCKAPCEYTKLAESLYGIGGHEILSRLTKINPDWQDLIIDPGIVQRLDDFATFASAHGLLMSDEWYARGRFAESLGSKKVYRALALLPEDYDKIRSNGIEPSAVAIHRRDAKPDVINFVEQMRYHLTSVTDGKPENFADYVQSVSKYDEVAQAVAKNVGRGLPIYLFELEIPVIDLLHLDKQGRILGQISPTKWGNAIGKFFVSVGQLDQHKGTNYEMNGDLESMVFLRFRRRKY